MADESKKKSPAKDAPVEDAQETLESPAADAAAPVADEPASAPAVAVRVYAVDRLIQEAEGFLGYASHIAAGALSELDAAEMTIAEAKARIDAWLNREVVA